MSSYEEDEEIVEERWIETEDSGDEGAFDMFADPDPYDTFPFTFEVSNKSPQHGTTTHPIKEEKGGESGESDESGLKDDHARTKSIRKICITLQGIKAENGQTIHSTGLTLWRASPILCDFLCNHYETYCEGKLILELGAGLGLCGLLAHQLGAKRVILTDGDTDSLAQMRSNVDSNLSIQDDGDEAVKPSTNVLPCCQLRWGKNIIPFKRKWTLFEGIRYDGFDVIMGSDIIYVEEILEPLFTTVTSLLSPSPDACFLLAYARRNVKVDHVFECAKRHGLKWTEPDGVEGVFIFTRDSDSSEK